MILFFSKLTGEVCGVKTWQKCFQKNVIGPPQKKGSELVPLDFSDSLSDLGITEVHIKTGGLKKSL